MKTLIKNAEQIVTVDTKGKNVKRGKLLSEISPLSDHSILVEDGIIKDFIPNSNSSKTEVEKIIDAQSCIILPGLVECHTHAAYAGSRANEFLMRLKGATYEEIAKAGGGITSTMKAVRNSSFEELVKLLNPELTISFRRALPRLRLKAATA